MICYEGFYGGAIPSSVLFEKNWLDILSGWDNCSVSEVWDGYKARMVTGKSFCNV